MINLEEKIVFAVSHDGTGDRVPLVILGIPEGGVKVKLVLFGGKDHESITDALSKARSIGAVDFTKDYSI
jgi:hypothetical protein